MSAVARQTSGIDRRNAPRTAFGKPVVRIEVLGREPIMACVVDISEGGAVCSSPLRFTCLMLFKSISTMHRAKLKYCGAKNLLSA